MNPEVIAAVATGTAGVIAAWAGLVKAKREVRTEVEEECQRRLQAARQEAEQAADELHTLRMRRDEEAS